MKELEELIASEQNHLNEVLGSVDPSDQMCWKGIMISHRLIGLRLARDLVARELAQP